MHKADLSIWFFNGAMLMIGGCRVYEVVSGHTPPGVLARPHAPLWWGVVLRALGCSIA